MLGAQFLVTGSFMPINNTHRMVVRMLNVETGAVRAQYRTDIANEARIQALLKGMNVKTRTPPDMKFKIDDGRVSITKYTGNAEIMDIPDRILGLPVTTILWDAFEGCNSARITIPSSITTIDSWAFANCGGLTSIIIPSSITHIGDGAFNNCHNLRTIIVDVQNPRYTSIDGVLFDKNIRTIVQYPSAREDSVYAIPASVTTIQKEAFRGSHFLNNVIIPSSVTSIGPWAFGNCLNLANITIPTSVTTIEQGSFFLCTNLTSIIIPSSVRSIGSEAFAECWELESVTLSRRTQLGNNVFPPWTKVNYSD